MLSPLLATKLYLPPARLNCVPRPRLNEKLNIMSPLTVVAAPAGFGKTTALSEWIPTSHHCVTWLSLDESDNDPTRFWIYVIAALQKLRADLGESALSLLQSPQTPPITSILTTLINEIASFPEDFSIVLDDYHLLKTQAIHEALTFLLDHLPPNMHIILTTRADPPLPLARLRARSQLSELRANDLRFTPDEAAVLLNEVMGLNLSAEDVSALETRTEGWIAGLQLAALSLQGHADTSDFIRSFAGSNRFVLDYLAEEVLSRCPKGTRNFLMRTSILDRLTESLCDAVTGQSGSQVILEELEHANLFIIQLDEERKWYRYHHLFSEVLFAHLKRGKPMLIEELHRRASVWFEQAGQIDDAVRHSVAAKDWERASLLIERSAESMLKRGEHRTLQGWLNSLPENIVRSYPRLCLARATALIASQQLDEAENYLVAAERVALAESSDSTPSKDPRLSASILGEVAILRTSISLFHSEWHRTIELAQQALAHLPADHALLRGRASMYLAMAYEQSGNPAEASRSAADASVLSERVGDLYTTFTAIAYQAIAERVRSHLHQSANILRRGLRLAAERGLEQTPILAGLHIHLAELLYEWNDLDASYCHAREAVELSKRGGLPRLLALSQAPLARILSARGDQAAALETMQQGEELSRKHNLPISYKLWITLRQVRLWSAHGNLTAAATWAQASGLSVDDKLDRLHEDGHNALARVLIKQGELDKALPFLARLEQTAQKAGQFGIVIEMQVLQAIALWARGHTAKALSTLESALTLAEPEGYIRIFVDEGEPMRLLISDFRLHNAKQLPRHLLAYADQLLAAFPNRFSLPLHSHLIEPLGDRELEVLHLIAEGYSNREIADKLIIGLGTVKTHINNLFRKLDVDSRTRALARARELNLLPQNK